MSQASPRQVRTVRRWIAILAVATAALLSYVLPASAAVSATVNTGSSAIPANARSAPSTSATVTRTLPHGSAVSLSCYVRGTTVSGGPYNVTTNLWYRLVQGDYVWDGLLATGSNNPVTPACSGSSAAATATQAFVNRYNGSYVDVDGAYGAQCWDLAARFTLDNGAGQVFTGDGAAAGIYENYSWNGNAANFLRFVNSSTDPSSVPRPGDVIVWNRNLGGGYGHVAIVVAANWNQVTVFEQNPGSAHLRTTDYTNVLGWLRLRKWA